MVDSASANTISFATREHQPAACQDREYLLQHGQARHARRLIRYLILAVDDYSDARAFGVVDHTQESHGGSGGYGARERKAAG